MKNRVIDCEERWITIVDDKLNYLQSQRDHMKKEPNLKMRLAMDMVGKWGMVAAKSGGEDSSGRSKLELQDPKELVERAMLTAELLVNSCEAEGWLTDLPHPDDIYGSLDAEAE